MSTTQPDLDYRVYQLLLHHNPNLAAAYGQRYTAIGGYWNANDITVARLNIFFRYMLLSQREFENDIETRDCFQDGILEDDWFAQFETYVLPKILQCPHFFGAPHG